MQFRFFMSQLFLFIRNLLLFVKLASEGVILKEKSIMNINEASQQWEKAAPGWAKWEDIITNGAELVTDKMLEMADISLGNRVLDLASGAGNQTLIAAKRVGPNGHVVANDISPTMLYLLIINQQSPEVHYLIGRKRTFLKYWDVMPLLIMKSHY